MGNFSEVFFPFRVYFIFQLGSHLGIMHKIRPCVILIKSKLQRFSHLYSTSKTEFRVRLRSCNTDGVNKNDFLDVIGRPQFLEV